MKIFVRSFINGVLTVIPIVLVFYVLYKIFTFLDSILGDVLKPYLKEDYIPGIGILFTVVIITLLGWLSTQYLSAKLIRIIDRLLEKIPLVKTIYSVIKDTFHSLLGEKRSFSKVALVEIPGTRMKSLGFITSEDVSQLDNVLVDHIAVYIPQTFQVAGFTFLLPKDQVTILDVKAEDAMKFVLSGGITTNKK